MVAPETPSQYEHIETIASLIRDIKVAMLATVLPDGSIFGRPMTTQPAPFDGALWFLTEDDSGKVTQIMQDQHVNVSYVNPDENVYVSLSGRACLMHDDLRAQRLWRPQLRTWLPNGLHDPHVTLLRVDVERVEYWTGPNNAITRLAQDLQAAGLAKRPALGQYRGAELQELHAAGGVEI